MNLATPPAGRIPALLLSALVAASCGGQEDGSPSPAESGGDEPPAGGGAPATFTPPYAALPPTDEQDRLPAPGDRTLYIPVTELFPGSARIDPAIENPYSGDAEAIDAGQRHFTAFNCAGCHMPLGGGGMGPPLSDDVWIYGSEPAQIYLSIMHGRPAGMPAWSSMLPRQTVWELIAYIETLSEIEDYAAKKGFESRGSGAGSGEASTGNAEPDSTEVEQ